MHAELGEILGNVLCGLSGPHAVVSVDLTPLAVGRSASAHDAWGPAQARQDVPLTTLYTMLQFRAYRSEDD